MTYPKDIYKCEISPGHNVVFNRSGEVRRGKVTLVRPSGKTAWHIYFIHIVDALDGKVSKVRNEKGILVTI